jgi:hypothetical protein
LILWVLWPGRLFLSDFLNQSLNDKEKIWWDIHSEKDKQADRVENILKQMSKQVNCNFALLQKHKHNHNRQFYNKRLWLFFSIFSKHCCNDGQQCELLNFTWCQKLNNWITVSTSRTEQETVMKDLNCYKHVICRYCSIPETQEKTIELKKSETRLSTDTGDTQKKHRGNCGEGFRRDP